MRKIKVLVGLLVCALVIPLINVSAYSLSDVGGRNNDLATQEYLDLTIQYLIKDSETPIAESYKALMLPGSDYVVESPMVNGYQIIDSNLQTVTGTLNENETVTVYYESAGNKKYTIRYVGLSIDGSTKEELAIIEGEAPVGEIITAEDKTFDGYLREPGAMTLQVTADGNAVLNVNYVQVMDPCIIFSTGGDYVAPITDKAGADITQDINNVVVPQRQGYSFDGWDVPDENGDYDGNKESLPTTMPDEDIVVKAIWTPGTSDYVVEYYFQNIEGDGYTRNGGMDEVRQATTESTVTASEEDQQKGTSIEIEPEDDFYGFDYSHCEDTTVTSDGQAVLKLYFDREIWTIKLHKTPMRSNTTWGEYRDEILPKQDDEDDIWQSFQGRYGSSFPDDFPTVEELIEYYDPLCPEDWTDYFYVNLLWTAQSSWTNGNGTLTDENDLFNIHNYENRKFHLEDETGSREINVYPYYVTGSNIFYIDYYLQDLDNPQNYTLTRARTVTLNYSKTWFNVTDDIEGFTIVGGSYRSKETEKEWPEPGDPPLTYDRTIDVSNVSNTYTLKLAPTYTPERDGYTFTGWYLDPELTNKIDELDMVKDYVVYAGWEANGSSSTDDSNQKYVLHFVTNGGTSYIDKGYDSGTTVELNKVPERDGYIFTGWYSDPDCTNKIDSVTMCHDTAVYAGWEVNGSDTTPEKSEKVYDVHFVLNGGIFTYTNIVESPTGLWTQVTSKDEENNLAKLPTKIYTDTDLRFVRQQYDLCFYSDNNLIEEATKTDIYYEAPLANYLEYVPSDDLANGRTFVGWCLSFDDDELVDSNMTMPAQDVTLYALWEDPKYTVTFDTRGGTEVSDQENIPKGETAVAPEAPTKSGNDFVGWYYQKDDGNWERWSFDQEITKDTTLYAVWRPNGEANYIVKHMIEGESEPFYSYSGNGKPGDTITARALGKDDEDYPQNIYLQADAYMKSLELSSEGANEIVFVYVKTGLTDYVVHYYLEGTTQSVAPDKIVEGIEYRFVTEKAESIAGYALVEDSELIAAPNDAEKPKVYKTLALKSGSKNELIFYYSRQSAFIIPAPVTIYMGGHGYEGTVTEEGELANNSGFPDPGFIIYPPDGIENFELEKAILKYDDGNGDIRQWKLVSYDGTTGVHNIVRFEPADETSNTQVRMQFVNKDGTVVDQDSFVIEDYLDQELTMEVYGDGIEKGYVTLKYGGKSYKIATATSLLKVRSTTSEVMYGDVFSDESNIGAGKPAVVANGNTIYHINDSEVIVENDEGVKLLFDEIVENNSTDSHKTNTELLQERTYSEIENLQASEGFGVSIDYPLYYECKYLDLVDTNNGNVWVSAVNDEGYVTVYWPLPEGTSKDTQFALFHYKGLHREMGVDEVEGQINSCEVENMNIEVTNTHIKFKIPRSGFSPFVLAWNENIDFEFKKVNKEDEPIAGAGFALYQLVCDDTTHNHSNDEISANEDGSMKNDYQYKDCWKLVDTAKSASDTGIVKFENLKVKSEYRLVEVKVPTGYLNPGGQWTVLYDANTTSFKFGNSVGNPPAVKENSDSNGVVYSVINYKPSELPFTGNTGTMIFFVSGSILMLLGGVGGWFLLKRKKYLHNL